MADFTQQRTTMVDTQVRPHDVTSFPVIEAMLDIPREVFVPDAARKIAYMGGPVSLGSGRQMLEPRTIGKMLNVLDPTPSDLVLEVGCGTGYVTALLARLSEAVVAIEEDGDLAAEADAALASLEVDNAVVATSPLSGGSVKHGPFDAIFVNGGVEDIPAALLDQLKEGGRIVAVFMAGRLGEMRLGLKVNGRVSWRMEFNATAPVLPGFARAPSFEF